MALATHLRHRPFVSMLQRAQRSGGASLAAVVPAHSPRGAHPQRRLVQGVPEKPQRVLCECLASLGSGTT